MSTVQAKEFSLDQFNAMMSMDMEQIPDLPEFGDLPSGNFRFVISKAETKDFAKEGDPSNWGFGITFKVARALTLAAHDLESCELDDDAKQAEKDLLVDALLYRRYAGEKGMSLFKRELGDVLRQMSITNYLTFMEKAEGLEIDAMIITRADKTKTRNDGTPVMWTNIEVATLAE